MHSDIGTVSFCMLQKKEKTKVLGGSKAHFDLWFL